MAKAVPAVSLTRKSYYLLINSVYILILNGIT